MKKICILLFISLITFFNINEVKAYEYYELPYEAQTTFENFIYYLNNGNKQIYNIIDNNNQDLTYNIDKYLNGININYELKNISTLNENHYKIETKISAKGTNWNVSGFTTYYEVKKIDNEYKIVDTNLFDVVGSDNVMNFILRIFAIIGGIMLSVGLVITIIVVIVIKKNRK